MTPRIAASVTTEAGSLALLLDGDTVVAAGFTDPTTLHRRLPEDRQAPIEPGPLPPAVAGPLQRYLNGNLAALDEVAVEQSGTEFQQAVWAALRAVPAGTTASYGELAQAVGRPNATRAVGSACGANLIAPFVPCHRAVRADGSLGGYAYGLAVKKWLLGHEQGQLHLDT